MDSHTATYNSPCSVFVNSLGARVLLWMIEQSFLILHPNNHDLAHAFATLRLLVLHITQLPDSSPDVDPVQVTEVTSQPAIVPTLHGNHWESPHSVSGHTNQNASHIDHSAEAKCAVCPLHNWLHIHATAAADAAAADVVTCIAYTSNDEYSVLQRKHAVGPCLLYDDPLKLGQVWHRFDEIESKHTAHTFIEM